MVRQPSSRSSAAARLITRVRPIWPAPTELRVSRRNRRSGVNHQFYLVLPSLRRPVLLVPSRSSAAAGAIVRFDEGQRAKLSLRILAWAQTKGLLHRFPLARVSVSRQNEGVLDVVEQALPAADTIVVRLGRPRHGRAVVLHALDSTGESLAFVKCAWGDRVLDLRHERDNLATIAAEPIPGIRAPSVLDFVERDGFGALILEALTPRSLPADLDGVPIEAMNCLAARDGWQECSLGQTPVILRLRVGIAAIRAPHDRVWLQREFDRLVSSLGNVSTKTGSWHGDWVPWNMAREANAVLLWDWEHSEDGVLPGFDHLHYLAQDLRLRVGTTPEVEDAWLKSAQTALATNWDLCGEEAEAAIRTYLLVVNLRYVADREGSPEASASRAGWSRQLLERLGGS